MRLFKIICSIILLIFVVSASADVYDDEGKVITKEEIRNEMGAMGMGSIGGCILGGGISNALFIRSQWDVNAEIAEERLNTWSMPILLAGASIGYVYGRKLDKDNAIKRIRERRRIEKIAIPKPISNDESEWLTYYRQQLKLYGHIQGRIFPPNKVESEVAYKAYKQAVSEQSVVKWGKGCGKGCLIASSAFIAFMMLVLVSPYE
jgi:hypothetical protein